MLRVALFSRHTKKTSKKPGKAPSRTQWSGRAHMREPWLDASKKQLLRSSSSDVIYHELRSTCYREDTTLIMTLHEDLHKLTHNSPKI